MEVITSELLDYLMVSRKYQLVFYTPSHIYYRDGNRLIRSPSNSYWTGEQIGFYIQDVVYVESNHFASCSICDPLPVPDWMTEVYHNEKKNYDKWAILLHVERFLSRKKKKDERISCQSNR